ncbi:MFS transporter [Paraburkholderia phytofirmans]|uniref:Major facilitator superfamily MFS_1 n=1 Tax=Paraburkholderia phytofirmans (strain DSM 17436 / LMG 22146 / PsJN) TaxID=398527 RepID=B2T8G3_PARPJ|nr:MFS transporter [Paraburkholderia phytofirmans]ACD20527.1 major facilitator superfamily MFS_1 [Paraburkholderia phytofirmans PsJN]
MKSAHVTSALPAPIYWLALGAFAIGTEGFMISPLLPGLAADLSVKIETAGQLVTVFALAYGLSSPVLTALSGNLNRRTLLLASMIAFALSNVLAMVAPNFWALMGARVLLALSAGLYVPGANALASAIVPPERRGRAIAVVNGGITIAIALGVPLGAVVGHALGWRMTFAGVAGLAMLAAAGLVVGLPRDIGAGIPVATLRERIAVGRNPVVLATLLTTTLWATGAYTVYTYLSPFLASVTGLAGAQIGMVMFMWGLAAAAGVVTGGNASDRFGPLAVIVPTIALSGLAFAMLSISARFLSPAAALIPVLVAIALWGVAHWAFYPAQQARLIDIAGLKVAPIVLSLNASFMYIGFSLGAALGALTLAHGGVGSLGWVAAASELAAVLLTLAIVGRPAVAGAACQAERG